uniref:Uncharacterized protein n=1 Tax=Schizaphis graminum TaxID=13262 RepID=A0A2S2NGK9_SCHGA
MYKYIYPNDMDQFSKMSTLGNKNSSTVIHLPPGILKTENSSSKTVISPVDNPKKTSERPRATTQKSTIIDHAPTTHSLLGNGKGDEKEKRKTIVEDILPTTERRNSNEDHTIVLTNENESMETTTIEKSKNEHEAQTDDDYDDKGNNKSDPILKSVANPRMSPYYNNSNDNSSRSIIIERGFSLNKSSKNPKNEQQNLYKSGDTRNNLILLLENDIKLKLFINSNGILNKSSPANSRKNPTVQLNDEPSTEDNTTINDSPIPIVEVE